MPTSPLSSQTHKFPINPSFHGVLSCALCVKNGELFGLSTVKICSKCLGARRVEPLLQQQLP